MGKTNFVFKRVEKKYLITGEKKELFLKELAPYIVKDEYGEYTICNIYYDTENDALIRNSLEKPVYKEKLRLRSYGTPKKSDKVFLEIKKKFKGTVFKRRITLTLQEAGKYLEFGQKPKEESQILNEIDYFLNFYNPLPKLYLAYDRLAYSAKDDPELRITFDYNIKSRWDDLELEYGDYGTQLLKDDEFILEIKTGAAFPLWLTNAMTKYEFYPVSFSKYGEVYKRDIMNNGGEIICLQVS